MLRSNNSLVNPVSPAHQRIYFSLVELASEINTEHEKALVFLRLGLVHAKRTGDLLIQAKSQVRHGGWQVWVSAHCKFSERTAQAYMRVAERWDELPDPENLSFREAVKFLAAPREEEQAEGARVKSATVALLPGPLPNNAAEIWALIPELREAAAAVGLPELVPGNSYMAIGSVGPFDAMVFIHNDGCEPDDLGWWLASLHCGDEVACTRRGVRASSVAWYVHQWRFERRGAWRCKPWDGYMFGCFAETREQEMRAEREWIDREKERIRGLTGSESAA